MVKVRKASFPTDLPEVRQHFQEYAAALGTDLCFQGFSEELDGLPGRYSPPTGGLWLAVDGEAVAGCVALRGLDAERGEIKRLYVQPAFRGAGIGRMLAETVLKAAADAGYRRVLLDTLPSMTGAIALYRSLGFTQVEPYYHNPVTGAVFLAIELDDDGERHQQE